MLVSKDQKIFVTQPSLPDLGEFVTYLEDIWETKWITNNGKYHIALEKELEDYLGVKNLSLFSNGTLALIVALKALEITGEVITTPYSFVASSHSLVWNNIIPIFCDVDPVYGNLDPDKIESYITDKTSAILAVHVYGNPAQMERINEIAQKYNLKVIYDAAHAFGIEKEGESILNSGDMSILSFHATKTYNTIEGEAIICKDEETKKKVDYLKNFGFENEVTVVEVGINAKMNELQAAYGLLQLKTVDAEIQKRKVVTELYRNLLKDVSGITFLDEVQGVKYNYSYFPIYVTESYSKSRDELYEILQQHGFYGRRYFYPLITDFPYYKKYPTADDKCLPNARRIADSVICLPLYANLEHDAVTEIVRVIKQHE